MDQDNKEVSNNITSSNTDIAKSAFNEGYDAYKNNNNQQTQAPAGQQLKPGDKVAPGKVVNKDGEVENSATREGLEAAANIASIFTGGTTAAATQAGKQAAAQGVKEAGKQAAKEGAKEAAKDGAKEAAKEGAKEAGKSAATSTAKGAGAGNKNLLNNKKNPLANGNNKTADNVKQKLGGAIDKGVGYLADGLEKNELVAKTAEETKEVSQAINGAFDTVGAATKGDVEGVKEGVKKVNKAKKDLRKKIIVGLLPILLFFIILIVIIILPFMGGYLTLNDFLEGSGSDNQSAWPVLDGSQQNNDELVKALIGDIPGYDSLSQNRKNFLTALALAIGKPYMGGGRPTDPTVDGLNNGVDSGGLLEWLVWNATGSDPGYLNGQAVAASSLFTKINESDLKPGDIGVNGDQVGVYVGNGQWVIVDSSNGVMKAAYSGFTSFYRFNQLDTDPVGTGEAPITDNEKVNKILAAAQLAVNYKVPYEYGGHATTAGIDGNHFGESIFTSSYANSSYIAHNKSHSHYYTGLDCSGFVGWALYTGLGDKSLSAQTTSSLKSSSVAITKSELQPGDLGFYSDYSHVGIYAGNGNWYQAGSTGDYKSAVVDGQTKMSKGYVKYGSAPGFVNYYRLKVLM